MAADHSNDGPAILNAITVLNRLTSENLLMDGKKKSDLLLLLKVTLGRIQAGESSNDLDAVMTQLSPYISGNIAGKLVPI